MADQGQGPNRGDPDNRAGRLSRTLALWVMVVVMSIFVVRFMQGVDESVVELDYTEFMDQVENGNVHEVELVESDLSGELRSPITRNGQQYTDFTTYLPTGVQESLVPDLRARDVIVRAQPPRQGWGTTLIGILPWLLLIAFWFWIFRTMQGSGNRAFQFSRSKAKMLSPEAPKVTFADVAGADEAKEELSEIIEFLKDPLKFARLGGRLPKGVLLVGPPGTGKTLLAKAVAGEAGRPFFQMSGSDFVEMFVGVGASRVRDLFEQGKAHAPCIIFIDEIDAVGRHRGAGLGGGHDEREQTLNALLVEMDGFESNEGVILLAATNRPDVLDPALLRPGRFDRQVVVGLPDVKGREQILKVHMRKVPLDDDVDALIVARGTPGFSGADLANLVNEAALFAARANKRVVSMEEFEKAKDKIMMGAERRSMVMSEQEKLNTAYHEAGHAIVGYSVPDHDPVYKVTIIPRGRALGVTMYLPEEDRYSISKQRLESTISTLFGGRLAEEMTLGPERVTTGASNDIERATDIARSMVTKWGLSERLGPLTYSEDDGEVFLGRSVTQHKQVSDVTVHSIDEEVRKIIDRNYARAKAILEEHEDKLHVMAKALMKYETIDEPQIRDIMEGREPRPPEDWEDPDSPTQPKGGKTKRKSKGPGAIGEPASEH